MKNKILKNYVKPNKVIIYKPNISERCLFLILTIYLLFVLYVLKNTVYRNIILLYIAPCFILFKVTFICLPKFIHFLNEKGLCGIDLNKSGKEYVAEPIGLFPSILYFIFVLFYQLIYYNDHRIEITLNIGKSPIIENLILKQHFLSIIFTIPFLTINLATFSFNFYPSKGFVGNTLTYFCGMFLAVVSIFGHFSKTLVLFLIPQFLNFFISLPQLFHIIPCPRHRLPIINYKTNKLMYSHNYTLINLILYLFGPLSEYHLVLILLTFQFLTCSFGLFLRYYI
ncbi:hypothetical protein PFFCH_00280 [Plasmodium falciparum FCH/4]|uniref:UDP-N-acetylglucosamine--dolichyl-phosphate N-acetylglucosaminephosphotransferase n=1 Tax=Plasmodium falciparum FCH/4 TaxID=1036724 RepID=A0A024VVM8_PLAFA|nr:hypothetical protein PFFCH_00280 [Plasmodium falciparum FCH/4]